MAKTYRVVFLELRAAEDEFREHMRGLGADDVKVEQILTHAPLVIRRDLSLKTARRYAEAVEEAGGRVCIQEHGNCDDKEDNRGWAIRTLDQFTMCPECGFKQVKANFCIRCGHALGVTKNNHEPSC